MATRERSPLYPSTTWNECVEFVCTIDAFKLKSVSYAEVARKYGINNITTRSFMSKVSTSKQFGLITTSNGDTIRLTDTCKRLLYPTGTETIGIALACFSMPAIYNKLIAAYDGKALPSETILSNILMSEHKIARSVKDVAAQCFLQSAEQLGLIQGGVLVYSDAMQDDNVELTTKENIDVEEPPLQSQTIIAAAPSSGGVTENEFIIQSLPMKSNKVAKLIIPNDADEESLLLLKDIFDAILRSKLKNNLSDGS